MKAEQKCFPLVPERKLLPPPRFAYVVPPPGFECGTSKYLGLLYAWMWRKEVRAMLRRHGVILEET